MYQHAHLERKFNYLGIFVTTTEGIKRLVQFLLFIAAIMRVNYPVIGIR